MSIDDTTATERNQPTRERARSRVATPAVLACCLAIYLFPLATVAEAHVKWFVPCNTSDNPIPLSAVLTSTFWLFVRALLRHVVRGGRPARERHGAAGNRLYSICTGSRTRWCGWERVVFVMREGVSCRLTTS